MASITLSITRRRGQALAGAVIVNNKLRLGAMLVRVGPRIVAGSLDIGRHTYGGSR